jgi:hypothetical protein
MEDKKPSGAGLKSMSDRPTVNEQAGGAPSGGQGNAPIKGVAADKNTMKSGVYGNPTGA